MTMMPRLGAFIVAFALFIVPTTLLAEQISTGGATVFSYNKTSRIVSGVVVSNLDGDWSVTNLRLTSTTVRSFATLPIFPPDPMHRAYTCWSIANQWNSAVYQNAGTIVFDNLLVQLAQNHCKVDYSLASKANADGSVDTYFIKPQAL